MGLRPVRSSPTLLRSNCNALLNLATLNIFVYLEIGDSNVPSPIHGLDGRICVLLLTVSHKAKSIGKSVVTTTFGPFEAHAWNQTIKSMDGSCICSYFGDLKLVRCRTSPEGDISLT